MIEFFYEVDFALKEKSKFSDWISRVVDSENFCLGELCYIFCDDEYLLKINRQYLNHDNFTDIITFDYTEHKRIAGDIFISIERIKENASKFNVDFKIELLRVMAHGLLHLMGYKDKEQSDVVTMRLKENDKMELFHVEH